jgi:hypothetical protein
VVQYFSLTAKQPQPAYKPQKQPAEQGDYETKKKPQKENQKLLSTKQHSYRFTALLPYILLPPFQIIRSFDFF